MGLLIKQQQGSKATHSSTWLKEKSKLTKDKVQPPHVIRREKDHTHGNSNNFNPGEGKDDAMQHFSTASDGVSDGCIGWCQRPNATLGIWTKSVHWDKQSRNKWHIKSTSLWYTSCHLWASHFCHCVYISCTYSCLLLAFREDYSLNQLCPEPHKCMVAGGSTSQSSKRRKKAAAMMKNWMRPLRKGDRLFKSHLQHTLNTATRQNVYTPKDTDSKMIQAAKWYRQQSPKVPVFRSSWIGHSEVFDNASRRLWTVCWASLF